MSDLWRIVGKGDVDSVPCRGGSGRPDGGTALRADRHSARMRPRLLAFARALTRRGLRKVSGCPVMGPLIVALMEIDLPLAIATDVRPFAAVGVPGGFTTFPGFAADVAVLWEGRGAHGACTP